MDLTQLNHPVVRRGREIWRRNAEREERERVEHERHLANRDAELLAGLWEKLQKLLAPKQRR